MSSLRRQFLGRTVTCVAAAGLVNVAPRALAQAASPVGGQRVLGVLPIAELSLT